MLWLGQLISAIGGGLTSFGLGVYIFEKTGSAASMALITLLGFLPTLLFSVPAGVLADRFDRRMLMMLGDGLSGLGVAYILIFMLKGEATLLQICIGVAISAIFSSLLEPAYKATVTDLLSEEEYSKASGLISLAGSARYLISPLLAGILLSISDIKLILLIDICTFILTVISTFVVKNSIHEQKPIIKKSFVASLKEGWTTLKERKAVFLLVISSSILTLFIGVFQVLAEPMILSQTDAGVLGAIETICASGMLVSSLYLGIKGLRKRYAKTLSYALVFAGMFIIGFGLADNLMLVTVFGFGFFLALPFANNCLDYLVRSNIPDKLQGRVWGIVGFLSQIGYVIAYGFSGMLADAIAKVNGMGVGKGSGMIMAFSGLALIIVAISLLMKKEIQNLEE